MGRKRVPVEQRFWNHVNKTPICWIWEGNKTKFGYGKISYRVGPFGKGIKTTTSTHRVSWMLKHGPIPKGFCILHKCDNPPCVRPSHLFIGTFADNMYDRFRKGKTNDGENNGRSKLTDKLVKEIRNSFIGFRGQVKQMAKTYDVHRSIIRKIVKRISWKHII